MEGRRDPRNVQGWAASSKAGIPALQRGLWILCGHQGSPSTVLRGGLSYRLALMSPTLLLWAQQGLSSSSEVVLAESPALLPNPQIRASPESNKLNLPARGERSLTTVCSMLSERERLRVRQILTILLYGHGWGKQQATSIPAGLGQTVLLLGRGSESFVPHRGPG